jgi:hypothetical protein
MDALQKMFDISANIANKLLEAPGYSDYGIPNKAMHVLHDQAIGLLWLSFRGACQAINATAHKTGHPLNPLKLL